MPARSRTLQQRTLSWCLFALLLLATGMPALSRMTCMMSGRSQVSVGLGTTCCPEEASGNGHAVKPACCEVLVARPERPPFTSEPVVAAPVLPSTPIVHVDRMAGPVEAFQVPLPAHSPPSDAGARRAEIGSYRI